MLTILAASSIVSSACTAGDDVGSSSTSIETAGPSTFPPLPTTTVATVPAVLIIGDFLTRDAEGLGLADSIAEIGWLPFIDTSEDRSVADGADVLEKSRDLGTLPRLIIVSLGANDACLGTPIEGLQPDISRIASIAGEDHIVVWVNLQMKDCVARAKEFNAALDFTAASTTNFFVADWASDAPIQRLEGDGIHYDRAGSEFRIDYFVSLLRMYANR
jgi:hypothetical protein